MLVYDDTSNEPIRIHDVGVEVVDPQNFGEHQMAFRTGDITSPRLATDEPLRMEIADFARSIRSGAAPRSNSHLGMDVVRMIEAAEQSMSLGGAAIPLNLPPGERRTRPDRRQSSHGMPWFDGPTTLPARPGHLGAQEAPAKALPRPTVEVTLSPEAPRPTVEVESFQT
jgi:hypothetical protein